MPDFDLVIFDCDGVLADSEVISAEILIGELARVGIALEPAYVFRHFVGKSFPGVAAIIRQSFDVPLPDDFEDRYRSALVDAFPTRLKPTPGLADMLAQLGIPSCVATSSSPRRVAITLRTIGIADHFGPRVFTASQVSRGKPAPDLFVFAAAQMGVAPERCLVIEDSIPGVNAALAANMRVWRYTGGAHFAANRMPVSELPASVPHFDNWEAFYLMDPIAELDRINHG